MKKLKSSIVLIAAIICLNLAFAENPETLNPETIANPMIEYLDKDVKLTNQQKDILKKSANEYALALLKARKMNKNDESYVLMKIVTEKYLDVVDSVLTSDQKNQKEHKLNQKLDEINKIANSKK